MYYNHFCSLKDAKYIVLVIRELLDMDSNNTDEFLCFKELEWAQQCYEQHQKGMGFPKILNSRLIKVEEIINGSI